MEDDEDEIEHPTIPALLNSNSFYGFLFCLVGLIGSAFHVEYSG